MTIGGAEERRFRVVNRLPVSAVCYFQWTSWKRPMPCHLERHSDVARQALEATERELALKRASAAADGPFAPRFPGCGEFCRPV
jgi:hypothetical protein